MAQIINRPTHIAYQVRESDTASHWTRIGAGWPHKDGQGFTLRLDAISVGGEIVIRAARDDAADAQEARA